MAMKVGDKCPVCKEGLIVRTELGYSCDACAWELEVAEIVAANAQAEVSAGEYRYRPATVKIRCETPEIAEEFLRGLILARQNNNSHLFVELIDGVNSVLEPWRAAKLREEMSARSAAGMT